MGRIVPMLSYADAGAAIDWLCEAFGFREDESMRHTGVNGAVNHAELELDGARVMVATPTPEYEGPRLHAEHCERARRWLDNPWAVDGVYVEIEDVGAHRARAAAAGARIVREPDNPFPGLRVYTAEDPEGHRWMFAQSVG